ncbi:MAG TPA: oxidoreductase, partial [Rhodospirillales bacterium]|nr:oxidoreductase [Rhodospirillales bacterium]
GLLTSDIRKVEFIGEQGKDLPPFTAGSHINLTVADGKRRSYSLANDPAERHRYVIAVLRQPNGEGGSAWIHDHLSLGDVVEASHPINNFSLHEKATDHLLIAGGIGITPLLSMAWALKSSGARATLHYCTRQPETTAFSGEIKDLFEDRVTFHHDGGDPSRGIDLKVVLASPKNGTCLYICGPAGLVDAARQAAAHWPQDLVRYELFKARDIDPADRKNDQAFDIVLSRQDRTITIAADKSILQTLQDLNMDVDFMCESGICGTCRTKLLGGKADHRDDVLDEEEKSENTAIMICSSRAMPGETLILDL